MRELLFVGLLSILGQVILLRELSVAFYGVELVYLLALGAWLFFTTAGVLLGRGHLAASPVTIALLFCLCALVMPLDVAFIRSHRALLGGIPGAYLDFPQQLTAMAVSMLPVSVLLGLLFQLAATRYVSGSRTLASAYAAECSGGLVGGLASTISLRCGIQNFPLALCWSVLALTAAWFCLNRLPARSSRLALAAIAGLALVGGWYRTPVDLMMTRWTHPDLVDARDTPYGRIAVTQTAGLLSIFENDVLTFESEGTDADAFAHLTLLQHPAPSRVLLLGGGTEGLVSEILKHRPRRIDYVELNRVMFDMVAGYLPEDTRQSLANPNVSITFSDPRRFIEGAERYDVIMVAMPGPTSGQTNRFYTREFFEQCAKHLASGGVLSLRLPSAENFWTPQLAGRTLSIHRALAGAFADVLLLPGTTDFVFASDRALARDPRICVERLEARGIKARLTTPAYVRYLYSNERFSRVAAILRTADAPPNTDVRPVCYQYAAMMWLSKFFPRLAQVDLPRVAATWSSTLPAAMLTGLALAFLLVRRRATPRRAVLVAVAGFVGMVIETMLLLHYQVKRGVMYQDVGVLLMSVMAGLTLGSWLTNRLARRSGTTAELPRWWGAAMLPALGGLGLGVLLEVSSGGARLVTVAALLVLTGTLGAAVFAFASLHHVRDQAKVISPLYAADLIGGGLGSLAASLVIIPLAGLALAARWMAALAIVALLLI